MTASTPISTEVGLSHDSNAGPAALPTFTRPDAIPPTAAPKQNGMSTEESANSAPSPRASRIVAAWPRIAKAAPRKMIPSAARKSGIERVEKMDPKATGNAVHTITSTKISHTWLASHTGLIERYHPAQAAAPLGAARRQVPE